MGKGLAYAALGAAVGAFVWLLLIQLTGWSLWVLAPIVGGCAGFGMMRGTQMRGGLPAGMLAAAVTLAGIVVSRYFVVSAYVEEMLAFDEDDVIDEIAYGVADEWASRDYQVYDEEEGDFLPAVYAEATQRWEAMSVPEQNAYVRALEEETGAAAGVMTPLGLLFDFGIFGTICALLAAGAAFKTGSITLEEALVQRGHAGSREEAAQLASDLRDEDGGYFARLGRTETPAADPGRTRSAA